MSVIAWIAVAIVAIAVVFIALIWKYKDSNYMKKDTDYKAFFWMGLIWIIFGAPFFFLEGYAFNSLFILGIVFFAVGIGNRDKWNKKRTIPKDKVKLKVFSVIAGVIAVLLGLLVFMLFI